MTPEQMRAETTCLVFSALLGVSIVVTVMLALSSSPLMIFGLITVAIDIWVVRSQWCLWHEQADEPLLEAGDRH